METTSLKRGMRESTDEHGPATPKEAPLGWTEMLRLAAAIRADDDNRDAAIAEAHPSIAPAELARTIHSICHFDSKT